MSRCVTCRIIARADGLFDITVTSSTGFTVRRRDLKTPADAEVALHDMRTVLAAHAWHLVHAGGAALA